MKNISVIIHENYLQDGTRRKEWQHYAALMAASVAKCIVENIPAESEQL